MRWRKAWERVGTLEVVMRVLISHIHNMLTSTPDHHTTHITHAHTNTEIFDNLQQQDAHEFLNYLLNTIADLLAGTSLIQQSLVPYL